MSFNDVATVTVGKMIIEFTFGSMNKSEAVNIMKKADISKKGGQL